MGLRDWFRTRKTADPTLIDLYERQRRLEVDMRALERAQNEAFDSHRRLLAKIMKRQQRELADADELLEAPQPDDRTNGHTLTAAERFRLNQLSRRR